ncbi:MAG: sulfite exporter TauE/SafE family protein [Pseudomonadota bacterium]
MADFTALLPPDMGAVVAVGLMGISFVTSLITAAFGIGGGVILIAVLASLLPPAALIPVHAVVQVGSNAGRALIMRAHIDWPVWGVFLIGTVVGVAIGGVIVVDLPPAVIQITVGLFILWTIIGKPPAFLRHSAWLAGGVSSVLTMFFGATGPFVAAYLKTQNYDRMTQVAMQGACMTAQHLLKVVAFGVLGFAFGPYIILTVGMIGFGFLGTIVGRRILMNIDEALFKRVLSIILVVLALRLIWAGASTYL